MNSPPSVVPVRVYNALASCACFFLGGGFPDFPMRNRKKFPENYLTKNNECKNYVFLTVVFDCATTRSGDVITSDKCPSSKRLGVVMIFIFNNLIFFFHLST